MYTRLKIQEAEFFWNKVLQAKGSSRERCFFVSAFLSALRSTTFVLQSEYKSHPEFQRIYPSLQKRLADNTVFTELRDARNVSLKQGHKLPRLLTRYHGKNPGDVLVVESDPIPYDDNAIRSISISMAERDHHWVPAETPEEEKLRVGMFNAWQVVKEITSDPNSVTQSIKLAERGAEYTFEELDSHVKSGLDEVRQAETLLAQEEVRLRAQMEELMQGALKLMESSPQVAPGGASIGLDRKTTGTTRSMDER